MHRYLIHHVLAHGFSPSGVIFPVSAAILERIDDYRSALESYSKRLLPLVGWEALPQEANFPKRYDLFKTRVESLIEMPASLIDLLFHFLKQNDGQLSRRARGKEFSALKTSEVEYIEKVYAEAFKPDVS